MTTPPTGPETTVIMDAEAIGGALRRMAQEIIEDAHELESLVLLGILRRGKPLADRLASEIGAMTGTPPKVGALSTQLYRDDLRSGRIAGITGAESTHFDFDVDGARVVMVDDVLFTGRTARAALDEIMDYGRPQVVRLACLIDRGLRELPIQADFLGWSMATHRGDNVAVQLVESDGADQVLFEQGEPEPEGEEG